MKFGLQLGLQTLTSAESLSNDTSLSEFTIDSEDVLLLSNIQRGNGVTEVPVTAVPTHPGATRSIASNTAPDPDFGPDPILIPLDVGDNTIVVSVVAEDSVTYQDHVVTVRRLTAGVQEVTELDFNSAPLFPGENGEGIIISKAGARVGFWAQSGAQIQPDWSAFGVTEYVVLNLNLSDPYQNNVATIGSVMASNGFTVIDANSASGFLTVTDPTPGARQDAEFSPGLSSAGATATVTQQGANPS